MSSITTPAAPLDSQAKRGKEAQQRRTNSGALSPSFSLNLSRRNERQIVVLDTPRRPRCKFAGRIFHAACAHMLTKPGIRFYSYSCTVASHNFHPYHLRHLRVQRRSLDMWARRSKLQVLNQRPMYLHPRLLMEDRNRKLSWVEMTEVQQHWAIFG